MCWVWMCAACLLFLVFDRNEILSLCLVLILLSVLAKNGGCVGRVCGGHGCRSKQQLRGQTLADVEKCPHTQRVKKKCVVTVKHDPAVIELSRLIVSLPRAKCWGAIFDRRSRMKQMVCFNPEQSSI